MQRKRLSGNNVQYIGKSYKSKLDNQEIELGHKISKEGIEMINMPCIRLGMGEKD